MCGRLSRRSMPGETLRDWSVDYRWRPRQYMVTTALFMEERSSGIGRNLIPEKSQCLPEAIERESTMPGGGPLQRMSKCAKSGAHTRTLLLQLIALSWQETSTRHWTAIALLEDLSSLSSQRGGATSGANGVATLRHSDSEQLPTR